VALDSLELLECKLALLPACVKYSVEVAFFTGEGRLWSNYSEPRTGNGECVSDLKLHLACLMCLTRTLKSRNL
jgi:hypothetical protein